LAKTAAGNAGEPLVIDGIRHEEVIESLRKLVAPLEMRVVYLDVDDKQRLETCGNAKRTYLKAQACRGSRDRKSR